MSILIQFLKEDRYELVENMILDAFPYQLIERDSNGLSLLHVACIKNQLKITELLLKKGVNVNSLANEKNCKYMTPLHYAASLGYKEIVKLLLMSGAKISAENEKMETPVELAIRNGFLDIAALIDEQQKVSHAIFKNQMYVNSNNDLQQSLNLKLLELRNSSIEHAQIREWIGRKSAQKENVVSFKKYSKKPKK